MLVSRLGRRTALSGTGAGVAARLCSRQPLCGSPDHEGPTITRSMAPDLL
jgi:hypothetical protein